MGCDYNKLTAATLFTPKLTAGKSNATSFKHLVLARIFSLKRVSSNRSSLRYDVLSYIYPQPPFHIFTQSIDAIDVRRVTLSRLNSINAIDI